MGKKGKRREDNKEKNEGGKLRKIGRELRRGKI